MLEASGDIRPFRRVAGLSMIYYSLNEIERKTGNGDLVNPLKIPKMHKAEYDSLIQRQYVSRIAFGSCSEHPYVAPFMYVFDGNHLYFLSTKYGRKMAYFENDPRVSVEIEEYAPDLSGFTFVSLQGRLEEVTDHVQKRAARERFVALIRDRGLSSRVLTAFGHTPDDAPEVILGDERAMVWRLQDVTDIVALKNG